MELDEVVNYLMNIFQARERFTSGIVRLVGYGLLVMALIDLIFLLIPPKFMNPAWELETIGTIIERIPVTLLGLVLVYYGERSDRAPIERFLLKWLSWLSLIFSILLFLTIPLTITNSVRIYQQHNATINAKVVEQIESIEDFKQELNKANYPGEISAVLQKQANQPLNISKSVDTKKLKTDVLQSIQTNQNRLREQARSFRSQKRSTLFKNCLKWNLGALIGAILFFFIWQTTLWSRLEIDMND